MDRIIYTAMNGAQRLLEQQAAVSNNLANINTTGFREQLAIQRAVPLQGGGLFPTRVSAATVTSGTRQEQGPLAETGNPLDVAIRGDGWFAVQTPNGEAYTRAGDFSIDVNNMLVTKQGFPVLSADGGPVELPDRGSVTFSTDGQISALGAGDNPRDIQIMGQLKLVNPDMAEMVRGDDGWFRLANGAVAQPDDQVSIASGFVEKSNVNPAEAMVAMINNTRRFEMQMKVISDASTREEKANSILSTNG
ncbi:flagellar basal-body rod protein FlgF [uncultured Paenalcaligenes sp.]|uniref:flagellar basal-body rod protein FlgF n=1 Tax=uncultured Paenalcaligenes sp. TaxID=1588925 RepID=UPI00263651DC|nr:flagellar basal-body rod protein FlgF [uncultured Paenalcaligenes sp.]